MVRVIYSSETCLQYLKRNADQGLLAIGLVLGQRTASREIVIHLVRTPEEKGDETENVPNFKSPETPTSVLGLSEAWVADHAKHVTRMLPGGMFVQGIFITSREDIFNNKSLFNKVKSILNYMYKCLALNEHMYGNSPTLDERLVLHMSIPNKVMVCKSVPVGQSEQNVASEVDWKILSKPVHWQRLDCVYEFDEIFPIIAKNNGVSVKEQFSQILQRAIKQIKTSVMFINGELHQESEVLELLGKRKKQKDSKPSAQDPPKSMNVSLFVPFENTTPDTVEYLECEGSIHFSGVVVSCVFLYPRATVGEAIVAVKQDIVRSLTSRLAMHCDALIDDSLLPEEKVCFNEPPRRVLVPLRPGGAADGLYLCDYLFPGEAPAEALVSVKELLDVDLTVDDVVSDLETPADTAEFDALDRDTCSEDGMTTPQEASQFMYIAGIAFAFIVLVVSIIMHYYQSIINFFS